MVHGDEAVDSVGALSFDEIWRRFEAKCWDVFQALEGLPGALGATPQGAGKQSCKRGHSHYVRHAAEAGTMGE